MNVSIYIRPIFSEYTNNLIAAEVEGNTIEECLDHLVEQFPGIEKDLFDKKKKPLSYIDVFVNGDIISTEDLAIPVKDGDKIHILPMIQGG